MTSSSEFFAHIPKIKFESEVTTNNLAYRYYDPERLVLGKKMVDHLRPLLLAHFLLGRFRRLWRRQFSAALAQVERSAAG
ncbi:MAG: hypothetical protein CMK06_03975 [Ponticaulis sp.]|nr:hypothetical protein [Ponticaulis sp.]